MQQPIDLNSSDCSWSVILFPPQFFPPVWIAQMMNHTLECEHCWVDTFPLKFNSMIEQICHFRLFFNASQQEIGLLPTICTLSNISIEREKGWIPVLYPCFNEPRGTCFVLETWKFLFALLMKIIVSTTRKSHSWCLVINPQEWSTVIAFLMIDDTITKILKAVSWITQVLLSLTFLHS